MSTNEGWDDITDEEAHRVAVDAEDRQCLAEGEPEDGDDAETALLVAALGCGS